VIFRGPHVIDPLSPWTYSPTGDIRSLCPLCDWYYDWPRPRLVIRPGQSVTEAADESFGQQHDETRAAIQAHRDEHAVEIAAREE
jgi:hypothetical protein